MIRVVCGDKAHRAVIDTQQWPSCRLVIAGVCIRPQAINDAGAVVLCSCHAELRSLVAAGYQPRLVPGLG